MALYYPNEANMKKQLLIGIFIILCLSNLFGQPCLPDGYQFYYQSEVDNFPNNYPNCTEIEGDVYINGYDITNLLGLNQLVKIGGDLTIRQCEDLSSLEGLNNIQSIDGELYLLDNPLLVNFQGLNNLTTVNGPFIVIENFNLESLDGLENLTNIGGFFSLDANYYLSDLSAISKVESLPGGLGIMSSYSLTELSGLSNINYIGEYFYIINNDSITSLSGLNFVTFDSLYSFTIRNNQMLSICDFQNICFFLANPLSKIEIYDNAPGCDNPVQIANNCNISLPCLPFGNYYLHSQNDIDMFQTNYGLCTEIGGDMLIDGAYISNLQGIRFITSVDGTLQLMDNENLTTLEDLDKLTSVGGRFRVTNNDKLNNLSGLENLTYIGGSCIIGGNDELEYLQGLDSLNYIGESLSISSNSDLINIQNLANLETIEGGFSFIRNSKVINLEGLDNVSYLNGELIIYDNFSLRSLSGLEGLTRIGNNIEIGYDYYDFGNPKLNTIKALINVTEIGGNIEIYFNDVLNSLEGLDNIDSQTIENLIIVDNNHLESCEVKSVCDYLANPVGNIVIHDNKFGCDDEQEVQAWCNYVTIPEQSNELNFSIYPNPATNELNIVSNNGDIISELKVYNHLGQKILTVNNDFQNIDISNLKDGVYIVELDINNQKQRQKLIIK